MVRVRFAPSPTGFLHIGGVRTALFNYLYTKHSDFVGFASQLVACTSQASSSKSSGHGKFLLRIEDTDTERSEAQYTSDILDSMKWLGLNWDEDVLFQSQRFSRYQQSAYELVKKGHAYFCTCSPQELEEQRKALETQGKKPMYSGKCRELNRQDPPQTNFVIRYKVPKSSETSFVDVVRGSITFQNQEIEDFIILRANGTPTYNLACVVDDTDGKITHVIRGDDHINNTPKQVLLFQSFNFPIPQFVHLPMILGPDKKKLSKRHGAVSANQYRKDGFLPHALINYLARLGWGHGDQEVFSKEELIQHFSLEKIGKSNAVFNPEKLLWLNGHYLRETQNEVLAKILLEDFKEILEEWGLIQDLEIKLKSQHGLAFIEFCKQKVKTLKELALLLRPFMWEGSIPLDPTLAVKIDITKLKAPFEKVLSQLQEKSKNLEITFLDCGIDAKTLEEIFRNTAQDFQLKLVELAQPTRFYVTGTLVGPALFDVLSHLRIKVFFERISFLKKI